MPTPLFRTVLLGLALGLAAASASAASYEDLNELPMEGRWMTHDDATTTSRCIGSAETAVCAIETMIACLFRLEAELCRFAHGFGVHKFETMEDNKRRLNIKVWPNWVEKYWFDFSEGLDYHDIP